MDEPGHDIHIATSRDCDAITQLWDDCALTRPWNNPATDFHLAVAGATSDILFVKQDDQMTATVLVGFDGHRGWVYYLGVSPKCRRGGLGRAMMTAAENWLKERNAPKIQLMVRDDNEMAIEFYKALGYEMQPVVTIGRRLDGD